MTETVDGMEFSCFDGLRNERRRRVARTGIVIRYRQGLVAFQTLRNHILISRLISSSFEFGNIFAIPADSIVAPHHRGLDLQSNQSEIGADEEIEELRRKIDNVRLTHHTQRVSHHSFRSAATSLKSTIYPRQSHI